MGREISLFSDYHQQENSLTNYRGLIMKLLYEDSPKHFEELITGLIESQKDIVVGPRFTQQSKSSNSIPDLAIIQKSFSVIFEVKVSDWFHADQIDRHIEGFDDSFSTKILILLSNFEEQAPENKFKEQIEKAAKKNIAIQSLTFESLIESLEKVCNTDFMLGMLEEFKMYLDKNELLPKWKYLLDVVSCSGTLEEINNYVYMCPDTGGSYSHRRAKFFGAYANKKVDEVFEIKAVVTIEKMLNGAKVKWKNINANDKDLENEAISKLEKWDWRINENKSVPIQVFLLDKKESKVNFYKETKGGMMQSKKYFWDIATDCKNSSDLAKKIRNKHWSSFE
jgi:hypothetical protein